MGNKEDDELKYLLELQGKRRRDRQQATTKRRRQGQSAPTPFSDLLNVFFKRDPELLRQLEENKAIEAWAIYVGEAASRVSRAIRLRNGTLTVLVKDGIWMQQLSFLKNGILARYRSDFPKVGVRDIFFKRQAF